MDDGLWRGGAVAGCGGAVTASAGSVPWRQVRAVYDESSLVVYQAYTSEIADAALRAGRFVAPFSPGADDVDQTLVPVDDVPLGMGE